MLTDNGLIQFLPKIISFPQSGINAPMFIFDISAQSFRNFRIEIIESRVFIAMVRVFFECAYQFGHPEKTTAKLVVHLLLYLPGSEAFLFQIDANGSANNALTTTLIN